MEGATLSLQKGNEEIATATTDASGNYLIHDVQNGSYNLVCTYGNSALTKIATVDNQSIVVDFYFPADDLHDVSQITGVTDEEKLPESKKTDVVSDVKALVKITDDKTPPIAVGGLDIEAMLHMITGKEVDLTFTAALLEGNKIPAADKTAIESISGELTMTYYDFSILKEIFANSKLESSEYLKTTKTVLEIAVPYDSSHAVGTYVFRNYNGTPLRLTQLTEKPTGSFRDGTYYVTADTVFIYASCYSTYAIGSADAGIATKGSDTITYSSTATVNAKSGDIEMMYKHDNDSTHNAKIELYLVGDDGNVLIAKSGLIPPGYELTEMEVQQGVKLPSTGTYEGLMKILYTGEEDSTADTNVDIPLSIAITQ